MTYDQVVNEIKVFLQANQDNQLEVVKLSIRAVLWKRSQEPMNLQVPKKTCRSACLYDTLSTSAVVYQKSSWA